MLSASGPRDGNRPISYATKVILELSVLSCDGSHGIGVGGIVQGKI